jgi:small subunit ribosomal protein S16
LPEISGPPELQRHNQSINQSVILFEAQPLWESLMSVRIRMKLMGRKHRPFYRICIMDRQRARDGKAIEEVGFYDTSVADKSKRVSLNMERVDYWLSVGAEPSEKVNALIRNVRKGNWGTAAAPPPMLAPKAPEPEPVAEAAPAESAEAPEATEVAPAEGGE